MQYVDSISDSKINVAEFFIAVEIFRLILDMFFACHIVFTLELIRCWRQSQKVQTTVFFMRLLTSVSKCFYIMHRSIHWDFAAVFPQLIQDVSQMKNIQLEHCQYRETM